jgi:hypothetical protein
MKNVLTLLIAILFSAGMAFAQNNDADVKQDGTGNIAEVEQVGLDNEAIVEQLNAVNNRAFVDQDGEGNEATLKQAGASGTQELHHGTINQLGDGNEAILDQSMWYGNVGHTGIIDQKGNRNFANLVMGGANNDRGTINQTGDDNIADVDQMRGASGTSNPAIVEVDQIGDWNEVYLDQHSSTWTHAYIWQEGDYNYVDLEQKQADNADIQQYGDNNKVAGVVRASWVPTMPLEFDEDGFAYQHTSDIDIYQRGDNNKVGFLQRDNNVADVSQIGDGNTGLLWQYGEGGHNADISQTGDMNTARVFQE